MRYLQILFLSFSLVHTLSATDNIWTADTKAISPDKYNAIINAYQDTNQSSFEFEDDITPHVISDIEDNILVLGLTLGYGTTTETVSNTRGSYDMDYTMSTVKLMLGKDFTLWHDEYTQPVRIYLRYSYSALSTKVDYTTITLGFQENMRYWPLYETDNDIIYPTLSYELGSSSLQRNAFDISGVTSEFTGGLTYQRGDFEYALNLAYHQTAWQHPLDGIKDEVHGLQVYLNLSYRWMYDE